MQLSRRFLIALASAFAVVAAIGAPACTEDTCTMAAVCDEGESEVASCQSEDGCRAVEACGDTIFCQEIEEACFAPPECTPPAIEVETCPASSTCETVSACGASVLCATDDDPNCTTAADCGANQFCNFPDGQCGAGEPGVCAAMPMVCSDGQAVCYCDGTITMDGDISCEGYMGKDFDETGTACNYPATAIACGHLVCDLGTADYCRKTTDDTGGPPFVSCSTAPAGCDPADCACLTEIIDGCGGSCTDGPNGPTVICPGG